MKAILLRSKKVARSATAVLLFVLSLTVQAQGVKPTGISPVRKQISELLNKEKGLSSNADKKNSKQHLAIELKRKQLHLKKDSLMRKYRIHPAFIVIPENKSKRAPAIGASVTTISKTVTVSAGGLFSALTDGERHSVNSLTVMGAIDARDFKTIRDAMPSLTVIDLSSATIAEYTGKAGTDTTGITKTYPANAIPQYAFYNPTTHRAQQYSSIIVPTSITGIGDYAFLGSEGLTSFAIPSFVTKIGIRAFQLCSGITSITIPSSVNKIKDYAFSDTGLTSITIPSSVDSIGSAAFYKNLKLTSATISSKHTGIFAFDSCTVLTSVVINNTVKTIDSLAFQSCVNLPSITIPSSVDTLGFSAFEECSRLTTANISAKTIEDGAFEDCKNLSSISLTNYVVTLGFMAFYDCDNLTSITIPSSVKYMTFAFAHCKNLTSAIINSSTTGVYAFEGDSALTSVTLMNGVGLIAEATFEGCMGLTSVTIPSSVTSIGFQAFCDSGLTTVTIPNSVTSIGGAVFEGCSGLTSITIPSFVTSIGDWMFEGCSSLASITIPSSVTSIGVDAFCGCSGLTSVTIPSSVTSIGDYAFCRCSGLTSVTIPNSVTSIGGYAFYYCSGLTSVTIPNSVTFIGKEAFFNCCSLTSIYAYPTTPVYLSSSSSVFNYVNKTTCTLYVPAGSKAAYQAATQWKDFTNIVEVTTAAVPTVNDANFSLYLNPMDNAICINGLKGTLQLYDINGRLLLTRQVAGNESVSVSTLPQGMYVVKLITAKGVVEQKIIKK
jgi:hypothetical protein